jgi:hypothetical protein
MRKDRHALLHLVAFVLAAAVVALITLQPVAGPMVPLFVGRF